MSSTMQDVFHGPHVVWWVWSLAIFALTSVLGYFSIELSARVLTIFLAVEIGLMFFYDLSVIAHKGGDGFKLNSFRPSDIWSGSIGIAVLFGGFEATVIFRDEVKNPRKTIPRATYLVVAFLGLAYAFTAWIFINAYGANAVMAAVQDPTGAATASVQKYAGHPAYDLASILTVTSSLALAISAHNICTRYAFNLGADRVLPRALGVVHRRYGSPARASVAVSVATLIAVILLIVSGSDANLLYARPAGGYAYAAMMLFVLVALAVVVYLVRQRHTNTQYGDGMGPAVSAGIALIFLVYGLWIGTKHFDYLAGATGTAATILLVIAGGGGGRRPGDGDGGHLPTHPSGDLRSHRAAGTGVSVTGMRITVDYNIEATKRDGAILRADVYRPDGEGPGLYSSHALPMTRER